MNNKSCSWFFNEWSVNISNLQFSTHFPLKKSHFQIFHILYTFLLSVYCLWEDYGFDNVFVGLSLFCNLQTIGKRLVLYWIIPGISLLYVIWLSNTCTVVKNIYSIDKKKTNLISVNLIIIFHKQHLAAWPWCLDYVLHILLQLSLMRLHDTGSWVLLQ